uniref:Uncharacterized protein n=1 Tax=Trichogramma kaykai TaxID=54128 RepID=A0ABD2WCF5_9HYME
MLLYEVGAYKIVCKIRAFTFTFFLLNVCVEIYAMIITNKRRTSHRIHAKYFSHVSSSVRSSGTTPANLLGPWVINGLDSKALGNCLVSDSRDWVPAVMPVSKHRVRTNALEASGGISAAECSTSQERRTAILRDLNLAPAAIHQYNVFVSVCVFVCVCLCPLESQFTFENVVIVKIIESSMWSSLKVSNPCPCI